MRSAVAIILRRPDGRLFVHRRSAKKRIYPGLFGIGAGGNVEEREEPARAAQRELLEETGLASTPTHLFSFPFSDGGYAHHMHVYLVTTAEEIVITHDEWESVSWMTVQEIDALSESNALCPDTKLFFLRCRDLLI